MSEQPLAISQLNDFIFCPVSIFFHSLETEENIMVQDSFQLNGTNAHKHSDSATYSTEKSVLPGRERILNNIVTDLNNKWLKQFDQTDSVYIFNLSNSCKIEKYGYARNEDTDLLIVK